MAGEQASADRDGDDHRSVSDREQRTTPTRQTRVVLQASARQAVDGGQVIGIEPVFKAEEKNQHDDRVPVLIQGFHGL